MNATDLPGGYLVLLVAFNMAVFVFVKPDKSPVQKWVYWAVVPVVNIVVMAVLFNDVVAGLGLGGLMFATLAVGYFGYRR